MKTKQKTELELSTERAERVQTLDLSGWSPCSAGSGFFTSLESAQVPLRRASSREKK
ncbi:MAG: hypothetical protein LVQ95_00315 [Candidatus Micrarchaeales archaeon]|nr:hypothetical protein [Candidatus Micrarchaeales archaeon]